MLTFELIRAAQERFGTKQELAVAIACCLNAAAGLQQHICDFFKTCSYSTRAARTTDRPNYAGFVAAAVYLVGLFIIGNWTFKVGISGFVLFIIALAICRTPSRQSLIWCIGLGACFGFSDGFRRDIGVFRSEIGDFSSRNEVFGSGFGFMEKLCGNRRGRRRDRWPR